MINAAKLVDADAAVGHITSGTTIAVGGILDRRRPMTLCRAIADGKARGLHVMSFLAGPETELLARAGSIGRLTTGYIDPRCRPEFAEQAIASGEIALHEVSEHIFVAQLQAAASGLPCWPTMGATGSDVAAALDLRDIVCPYTGRPMLAVRAATIDVAILHAAAATTSGLIFRCGEHEFLDDADLAIARAAQHVIVSADTIVDEGQRRIAGEPVLAPFEVDAIVHTPEGGSV